MNISLRLFTPDDQEFLFQLYSDVRRPEISAWGWNEQQQEMFLRMQFNAQQTWYESAYSGAEHRIIECDSRPAGRILVMRSADTIILVDIALLAEFRGHGIGARLISELLQLGARDRIPVRLHVLKTNPAQRLYQRLGFVQTGEDDMYLKMERLPH
jgi:ribosomal protein S18 acetylase RimI-like enzyme